MNKNGVKFENGRFPFGDQVVAISELAVFNDGIVVNANSTEGGSIFLEDLLGYVRSQFEFREFSSMPRQIVASQVVVDFETSPAGLLPTFGKINALIAKETHKLYDCPLPMDFVRLEFQLDKAKSHLEYAQPRFLIERRTGVAFSQERYYCSALMHTKNHLSILEQIERLLAA
jgi:hypothetical protein